MPFAGESLSSVAGHDGEHADLTNDQHHDLVGVGSTEIIQNSNNDEELVDIHDPDRRVAPLQVDELLQVALQTVWLRNQAW